MATFYCIHIKKNKKLVSSALLVFTFVIRNNNLWNSMKVFVIPTWHPTPTKPLWCNWILPHIALLKENGIEAYVLHLGLDDEPTPINTDPWNQPVRQLNENHLYVPIPQPKKRFERTSFFYGNYLTKYVKRLSDLYQVAIDKWGKPDILHAHVSLPGGYGAACLGNIHKIPVIVQEHYSGFESDVRFWWRKRIFIRDLSRKIEGLYAVSPGFAERIRKTGIIDVKGILPNPIDTELFKPLNYDLSYDKLKIVTTGNVGKLKGTDILLKALSLLPKRINWSLTIFGECNDSIGRNWVSSIVPNGDIKIRGRVTQERLVKEYSKSSLFVVSSRIETANVSMLEAISCGIPVLTTRCGAPETLIDNSVGLSVKPKDPHDLSIGIIKISEMKSEYEKNKLHQFVVEKYSKTVVINKIIGAYMDIMK